MTVHYQNNTVTVNHGNCLDVLAELPDNSVDAVITDPPYGLANTTPDKITETLIRWVNGERDYLPTGKGFMGKEWDAFVPPVAVWDDCMRVLKPGGHALVFAGTRTMDLMTLGLRLAGFDIRDSIAWLYGSGFPKSQNVSKAIDKAAGATREVIGTYTMPADSTAPGYAASQGLGYGAHESTGHRSITAPATEAAAQWAGWGTALKPAFEPVVVARKPLAEKTVAANVLAYGTGAINVDACRIGTEVLPAQTAGQATLGTFVRGVMVTPERTGRWPANVVLDEDAAAELDEQSGPLHTQKPTNPSTMRSSHFGGGTASTRQNHRDDGDATGASRFFYCAKAPKRERPSYTKPDGALIAHPTVKPLTLMRWLVRLATPPGGLILDPFAGSGATTEAAILEGFRAYTVEQDADYLPLILQRIERNQPAADSEAPEADLFTDENDAA